jgi:arsenate reductase (thioredoxin)
MQIPLRILFICTHNRCRSILAEAIANHVGEGCLIAASAGSEPSGEVHPLTLQNLQLHGIPATALRSKSWDELKTFAPHFVITVCDSAAAEPCPLWLGKTRPLHWGIADPSVLAADEAACRSAFDQTIAILTARLLWLREGVKQGLNLQGLEQLIKALADTSERTGRQEAQWACSNAI